VVLYAMTAEKARLDPKEGAANLNALQWGWFAACVIALLWHIACTSLSLPIVWLLII